MPLFRRRVRPSAEFTVGVHNHRVQVGGDEAGCPILEGLRDYVGKVTADWAQVRVDGREPVAVLSAKMDYAELVDDAAGAVVMATEELVERGVLAAGEIPPQPELPPLPTRATHYEYIRVAYARAEARMDWLERACAVLSAHAVAVLPPAPPDEERRSGILP